MVDDVPKNESKLQNNFSAVYYVPNDVQRRYRRHWGTHSLPTDTFVKSWIHPWTVLWGCPVLTINRTYLAAPAFDLSRLLKEGSRDILDWTLATESCQASFGGDSNISPSQARPSNLLVVQFVTRHEKGKQTYRHCLACITFWSMSLEYTNLPTPKCPSNCPYLWSGYMLQIAYLCFRL